MVVWKRIIHSARIFKVYDFSRVYKVLDFMFEADAVICKVVDVLVEFAVLIWVITWGIWVWWVWIR